MLEARLTTLFGCIATLATALAPGLEVAYSLERATQGIAISPDGRKFLSQRYSTQFPPQAVELLSDNTTALTTFVNIDGARIGPDGCYWLVDGGSTGLNGSTKFVGMNSSTNTVDSIYYLDDIKASDSGIDDVRFGASGDMAYLSDTANALLVLNLTTGNGVRVLFL
ncbi:hypothetical protein N7509_000542 [Penicillium cosmopolitanum]|uniref:SMP-30/Gluconolactonase/LRE-like region domain-containing protein n=1 Tax=Penicillium cosmopolitanum TaxID=1131564 RepID=A0A9X0BEA1_9EURO|nr:uncharacterized protein N7509_000542 [Penicillium cosmopolitanum]KAJ5413915.1 hypothetical protein N7509_000542 [Penicillium cosmopolitanum]